MSYFLDYLCVKANNSYQRKGVKELLGHGVTCCFAAMCRKTAALPIQCRNMKMCGYSVGISHRWGFSHHTTAHFVPEVAHAYAPSVCVRPTVSAAALLAEGGTAACM